MPDHDDSTRSDGVQYAAFSVAPGTVTALSNRGDTRAHFLLEGDLSQMGRMEELLRARGFPVVKRDVYPGFQKQDLEHYVRALQLLWDERVDGWWNQETALIAHGVCTKAEFEERFRRLGGADAPLTCGV